MSYRDKTMTALNTLLECIAGGMDCSAHIQALAESIIEEYSNNGSCEYISSIIDGSRNVWVTKEEGQALSLVEYYYLGQNTVQRNHLLYKMSVNGEETARIIDIAAKSIYRAMQTMGGQTGDACQTGGESDFKNAIDRAGDAMREDEHQSESLPGAAEAERELILKEARRIYAAAEQRLQSAEQEAQQILCEARNNAGKEYNRLLSQYLNSYQQNVQAECAGIGAGPSEVHKAVGEAKARLNAVMDEVRRDHRNMAEQLIVHLQTMQQSFSNELRGIQKDVYCTEFEGFADCYCQLYRILRFNPLLTDQLTSKEASDGRYAPETIKSLIKLKASLTAFLKSLEKSMERVGLYVYVPAERSLYDDVFCAVEDRFSGSGTRVARCITPGVMLKDSADDEDGTPVIRAVVTLQR